jgi:hypothetical protein
MAVSVAPRRDLCEVHRAVGRTVCARTALALREQGAGEVTYGTLIPLEPNRELQSLLLCGTFTSLLTLAKPGFDTGRFHGLACFIPT